MAGPELAAAAAAPPPETVAAAAAAADGSRCRRKVGKIGPGGGDQRRGHPLRIRQ